MIKTIIHKKSAFFKSGSCYSLFWVKEFIESCKDKDDLDIPNFDNILSDAYDANVWDEMIETLKQAGIILYKPDTDKILEECEERHIVFIYGLAHRRIDCAYLERY